MRPDPSQRGGASVTTFPARSRIARIPQTQPRRWTVSLRRLSVITAVVLLGAAAYRVGSSSADDWLPISAEELKMTSVAEAPGAPAVYLYRQVDRSDEQGRANEFNYVRIKILTEE